MLEELDIDLIGREDMQHLHLLLDSLGHLEVTISAAVVEDQVQDVRVWKLLDLRLQLGDHLQQLIGSEQFLTTTLLV